MRRMKRVPGIIRAQISLRKMEKEDGPDGTGRSWVIS